MKLTLHINLPPRQAPSVPAVNTTGLVNPYTMEEERLWQAIVGSELLATAEHVAAFERATGKKHDRNYLI